MLSTAMKAPSVAPNTAIQVLTDTVCEVIAVGPGAGPIPERSLPSDEPASDDPVLAVWSAVMAVSPLMIVLPDSGNTSAAFWPNHDLVRRQAAVRFAFSLCGGL